MVFMRRNTVAIVQVQREVIEELRKHAKAAPLPERIESTQLALDDGTRLHVLGISEAREGVHGANVLVVGDSPPSEKRPRGRRDSGCAYAVLLRTPTKQELDQWHNRIGRDCLLCVELLRLVESSGARAIFGRTGRYTLYPQLI